MIFVSKNYFVEVSLNVYPTKSTLCMYGNQIAIIVIPHFAMIKTFYTQIINPQHQVSVCVCHVNINMNCAIIMSSHV